MVRSCREPAGVKIQTQEREEALVSLPNPKGGEGGATQLRPSGTITRRGCRSLAGSHQPPIWELPLIFHTKRDPTTTSPAPSSSPLPMAALFHFSYRCLVTFLHIFSYILLRSENHGVARRELDRSAVQTPAQSRAKAKGSEGTSRTPCRCGRYFSRMWASSNDVLGLFPIPLLKVSNTVLAFLTRPVNRFRVL